MNKIFSIFLLAILIGVTTLTSAQLCPLGNNYTQQANCGDINPGVLTYGTVAFCIGDSIGLTTSSDIPVDSVWICWGDGTTSVSNGNYISPIYNHFSITPDSCMCNGSNSTQLPITIAFYASCPPTYSYDSYSRNVTLKFKPRAKFTTLPSCPYSPPNIYIPPCTQACANGSVNDTTRVIWDMGDGSPLINLYSTNSTIPLPNYSYPVSGTYTITLTMNNDKCGNASYNTTIKILPNTILNPLLASGPFCAPGNITITNIKPAPAANYSWSISPFVSGVISTDSTLFATIPSPNTFIVNIDVAAGCCSAPQSICHWDSTVIFGSAPLLQQNISYNTSCDPVTINFSNSFQTTLTDTHKWTIDSLFGGILFPIFTSNAANPPSVLLSNIGTYILTAIVTNLCSSDTIQDTLKILGPTTFNPTLGPIPGCAPDSIKILNAGAINATGLSWTSTTLSGGVISPSLTNITLPTFQINGAGSYSINGSVTGCCTQPGSDCSFNQIINIDQSPKIIQVLNYGDSCNTASIKFSNNFQISYADSVKWRIDSISSGSPNLIYSSSLLFPPDYIVNTAGTYIISLTAFNDCSLPNGILLIDTFTVLPPTIIAPLFTLPTKLCAPNSIIVANANAQNATSLSWASSTLSGGTITPSNSIALTPTFQINSAGSYEIKTVATGCCNSPQSICLLRDTFNFKQSPILNQILSIDDRCDSVANFQVTYSNYFNFQSQIGDLGYLWKVVDQNTGTIIYTSSSSTLPIVPITSFGSYFIYAIAWNDCDSIVLKDTFNLSAPASLNIPSDTIVCKNSSNITLVASPLGGIWTMQNDTIIGGIFIPSMVSNSYNYILYTVGTNECQLKDSIQIIVSGAEVTAGPNLFYCDNQGLDTLIGIPGNLTGIWSGIGIIDSIIGIIEPDSISLSPSQVIYTVTDSICVTKDTLDITVYNSPSVQPLIPDTACIGDIIKFINPSSSFNATWTFGDGSLPVTGDTINKSYTATGNYTINISLTTVQNCNRIFSHNIYVTEPPIANFTLMADSICNGDSVLLLNTNQDSVFTKYYWTYGTLPKDTVYNSGYLVWNQMADSIIGVQIILEAENRCGIRQKADTFFVKPFPKALFNVNQNTGCSPDTISISNVSVGNPQNYSWYLDNVLISTDSSISSLILTADSIDQHYSLTLIVTNDCFIDTLTRDIVVGPPKPVPFFNITQQYGCIPLTVTLVSSVQANSIISWNFGDGNIGMGDSVIHTFTNPGSFEITQYATGCGVDSIKQKAIAYNAPTVSFDVNATNCVNSPVQFINTSPGINAGVWDYGDGSTKDSTTLNPSHQYLIPGIYNVTLTGYGVPSAPGISCINSYSFPIAVVEKPEAIINITDNADCFPFILNLKTINLSQNANRYDWYFGNGDTIRGNLINNYSYNQSGIFPLTLIAYDNNNCSDTAHFNYINVYPEKKPKAIFEPIPREQNILNPVINVRNNSTDAIYYSWDFGNNFQSNLFEPNCIYNSTGEFPISLSVENNFGCRDSITQFIIIRPTLSMYIPNAFTPDGRNPVFKPKFTSIDIQSYIFRIYDRWGNKVFETTNPDIGWDGTQKGKLADQGIYVYIIKAKRTPFDNADPQNLKYEGRFTLLR